MLTCYKCKVVKNTENFYSDKRKKTGFHSWCKECEREHNKQPHIRERLTQNAKRYRAKIGPEKYKEMNRRIWRKWRYKISPEAYERMFKEQNGSCAICQYQYTDGRVLQIDHDHNTGTVRGLLCKKCNTYIGMIGERLDTIDRMRAYLSPKVNS